MRARGVGVDRLGIRDHFFADSLKAKGSVSVCHDLVGDDGEKHFYVLPGHPFYGDGPWKGADASVIEISQRHATVRALFGDAVEFWYIWKMDLRFWFLGGPTVVSFEGDPNDIRWTTRDGTELVSLIAPSLLRWVLRTGLLMRFELETEV